MCVCERESETNDIIHNFNMIFLCAGLWLFTIFIIHIIRKYVAECYVTSKTTHRDNSSKGDDTNQHLKPKIVYQQQTSVNSLASLQTVIYNPSNNNDDLHHHQSRFEETITTQSLRPKSNSMSSSVAEDQPLRIEDIADLLHPQYAIITGGRAIDTGSPLITFPDNNNFQTLEDCDYQRLIQYLIGVFSLQDADLGFQLIIDRRKSSWASVKAVLFKISVSIYLILMTDSMNNWLSIRHVSVLLSRLNSMRLCDSTFRILSESDIWSEHEVFQGRISFSCDNLCTNWGTSSLFSFITTDGWRWWNVILFASRVDTAENCEWFILEWSWEWEKFSIEKGELQQIHNVNN